ncbi:dihydrodipicolinate synthase family protein [Hominifimenecus sp. rT4P-3]|uniref:dihydrodipicolinate synthase family protein n=1 Tax=Hominifimenecus sp. rT4P-3 TaxID=3242979 RepID=UPI003DA45029
MKKLEGVLIPAVTPFDDSGALRLDWLRENYERWNRTDVNGCMALGSNGEYRALDDEESLAVIKAAGETLSEEKIFMAGIARESLYQTLCFLRRLQQEKVRIDYASVLTPCYFKNAMTDEALIDYFTTVANESPYPVVLYCAPGFANGVCISVEAVKVLADHPNIVGIKDTSPDMMTQYLQAVGGREDFAVFSGTLGMTMTCLAGGGQGGVLSSANYFPEVCARLYQIFREEGLSAATDFFTQLKGLIKETGGRAGIAGVKATMNLMGFHGGVPRKPVLPCSLEEQAAIAACIDQRKDFILGK